MVIDTILFNISTCYQVKCNFNEQQRVYVECRRVHESFCRMPMIVRDLARFNKNDIKKKQIKKMQKVKKKKSRKKYRASLSSELSRICKQPNWDASRREETRNEIRRKPLTIQRIQISMELFNNILLFVNLLRLRIKRS